MNLSENLKKIRKENNLSQEELAEKLGVSRQSVSKWESGIAYPEMDKMLQLCKMFNLNIDELLNQNISDKKEIEIRRNKFNKQVDSFLDFITKTVNMFSSMKLKEILKCLLEQITLCLFAVLIFYVYAVIISFILNSMDIIPLRVRDFITMLAYICYLVFAAVVLIHIFKIRYLDYYKIVNRDDIEKEIKEEITENKKENVVVKKQYEKIIIRDPEKSSAGFFNLLARIIMIMFKSITILLTIPFIGSFVFIIILMVLSFLFIKTGLMFIGCIIGGTGALLLNALIIVISYNYVFDGKFKWNRYIYEFLISLILCGIGIGCIVVGLKDFNLLDYNNEKYYTKETKNIEIKDNLNVYYYNAHYVETDISDVKIELIKPKYSHNELYYDVKNSNIYVYNDSHDFMNSIRFAIDALNDKYVFNNTDTRIFIYGNVENLNKIQIKR